MVARDIEGGGDIDVMQHDAFVAPPGREQKEEVEGHEYMYTRL